MEFIVIPHRRDDRGLNVHAPLRKTTLTMRAPLLSPQRDAIAYLEHVTRASA